MLLLIFLVYVTLLAGGTLGDLDTQWRTFKTTNKKQYGGEESLRRGIWEDNLRFIEKHNNEADAGLHTFRLGMNKYADLTSTEFSRALNGFKQNLTDDICERDLTLKTRLSDLPVQVDWSKEGYVTAIKDQGDCLSCWAFSATGALEGQHYKKTQKLVSLSEKNLMDCSWIEGNAGCNGGLPVQAFTYIIRNGGVDTEESYPYEPKDGMCKFDEANIGATMTQCYKVGLPFEASEDELQVAVAEIGPISVGIDASAKSFQLYKSGIYISDECGSAELELNHGVLAVGYGVVADLGAPYWIVKNSWGTSWGENGYIKMRRNYNNMCGIATAASYPVIEPQFEMLLHDANSSVSYV